MNHVSCRLSAPLLTRSRPLFKLVHGALDVGFVVVLVGRVLGWWR
jgi:hypothetical protein